MCTQCIHICRRTLHTSWTCMCMCTCTPYAHLCMYVYMHMSAGGRRAGRQRHIAAPLIHLADLAASLAPISATNRAGDAAGYVAGDVAGDAAGDAAGYTARHVVYAWAAELPPRAAPSLGYYLGVGLWRIGVGCVLVEVIYSVQTARGDVHPSPHAPMPHLVPSLSQCFISTPHTI